MTLVELDVGTLSLLYLIIFFTGLNSIRLGQEYKISGGKKVYIISSYGISLFCFILLQIGTRLSHHYVKLYRYLKDFPLSLLACIILLIVLWEIVIYRKIKKQEFKPVTRQSIKESLDTLPVGAAFSDNRGHPYLVNYRIEMISRSIFGKNVLNTEDFFNKTSRDSLRDGVKVLKKSSDHLLIKIEDKIWQIETVDHGSIKETLAKDVTKEHLLIEQIRENNNKIQDLNQKLKIYNSKIDSFIREKELLSAKRKIHDNIGQALIFLRIYLESSDKTVADRDRLINLWKQNIVLLKGGLEDHKTKSKWDKLKKAAEITGIDLKVDGVLPREERLLSILTDIVHESVNNAIRHGQAKSITLCIDENDRNYLFKISNDGNEPEGPIIEKGGIKNIRKLVEMEEGTMELRSDPEFIIEITLPKGAENEV